MKARVAIGLTTYADISDRSFGAALYDAYASTSEKLVPKRAAAWLEKYQIGSAKDFGEHWRTIIPYEARPEGVNTVERGNFRVGLEWTTPGVVAGRGEVSFRSEVDPNGSDGFVLEHSYSDRIDWSQLFRKLVDAFNPSHAMLHLFTQRELDYASPRSRFGFTAAFCGEAHFTTWLSSLGEWRRPDHWDTRARRQYVHLPELGWANFLGKEFVGQYDEVKLAKASQQLSSTSDGIIFRLTDRLSDVELEPDTFEAARAKAKAAFAEGFFRQ